MSLFYFLKQKYPTITNNNTSNTIAIFSLLDKSISIFTKGSYNCGFVVPFAVYWAMISKSRM